MSHNEMTYVDLVWFVSSGFGDNSLTSAILMNDDLSRFIAARRWWRAKVTEGGTGVWWGDLMRVSGARLLAELFETLLVIDAVREFFMTYN